MSNADVDWFARKMGQKQPPKYGIPVAPAPQPQSQPVAVPQQHPQQGGPPAQEAPVGTEPQELSTSDMLAGRGVSKGADAARIDGDSRCPSCGSRNFFSNRTSGNVVNPHTGQMVAPRPKCYECGYNGYFMQGEKSNWA